MYIKNNKGPRIEPCAAPHSIISHLDILSLLHLWLSTTVCCLLVSFCPGYSQCINPHIMCVYKKINSVYSRKVHGSKSYWKLLSLWSAQIYVFPIYKVFLAKRCKHHTGWVVNWYDFVD
jgi:hypothetical protein